LLQKKGLFDSKFERIVFAIKTDKPESNDNFLAFNEAFRTANESN
jgi:hypothetical protein